MNMRTTKIHIDGHAHTVPAGLTLGKELLALAGVNPPQQLVLEVEGELDVPILPEDRIILSHDRQRFSTGNGNPPLPDNPCLRRPFDVGINDIRVKISHPKMTGADLKALDPSSDKSGRLFADLPDLADEWIDDGMRVIVQRHEAFAVSPCGNVGDSPLVRDLAMLKNKHSGAELRPYGANSMLVIPGFELPRGWSHPMVDLMVIIPASYPLAAVDMFWVSPTISLSNGCAPEAATLIERHGESSWQRFSWHYKRPWNPTKDTLTSHISFCAQRLNQLQ